MSEQVDLGKMIMDGLVKEPIRRRQFKKFLTVAALFSAFMGMSCSLVWLAAPVSLPQQTFNVCMLSAFFSALAVCFIVWFMALTIQDE